MDKDRWSCYQRDTKSKNQKPDKIICTSHSNNEGYRSKERHHTTPHYTTSYYTILHYTLPHHTILHYSTLYCIALHCTKKSTPHHEVNHRHAIISQQNLSQQVKYDIISPGFAEARMDVRAFRVAMMPALVIDTVCCSIASCRIAL